MPKTDEKMINELYELIASMRNAKDCKALFDDLCTVKEIEQMTNISKSTLYREIGRLKDEAQYEELKKKLKK